MFEALSHLDSSNLRDLAAALKNDRLAWPNPPEFSLAPIISQERLKSVTQAMAQLGVEGFSARQTSLLIESMAVAKETKQSSAFDLVWTGPDMPLDEGRSTLPVVNELFLRAQKSILITGFALYDGKKIFESLVRQIQDHPSLDVVLVLNIPRKDADTSSESAVVERWAADFLRLHWKSTHLPKVYYDPRSLIASRKERAVMHAKCIIVDRREALISSANLTEAAQRRNIEAGLLVKDPRIARMLDDKFQALIQGGHLVAVGFQRELDQTGDGAE